MNLRRLHPVHRFCAAISAAGLAVLAIALASSEHLFRPGSGIYVALLAPGVLVGELLPVKIPRRGDDEEIAFSTTFAFALLIAAGLPVALVAQAVASALQDVVARKPLWRLVFNVGQYTLSLACASLVMDGVTYGAGLHGIPFGEADLPAIVAGGTSFFVVNTVVVGIAIALYQRASVLHYLRSDFVFSLLTSAVLLCLAPVVLAAMSFSPLLYPACLLPIAAVYQGGRQAARAEHQATHDALTGLPNRSRLEALVERAIEDRAGGDGFALLLMDLNRFKEINDTLGHHHGDLLLRQMGARLESGVREGDVVARLGGDEFVVLVTHLAEPGTAERVAERVRTALREPFQVGELTLEVDASIGIARFPADGEDVETLLQRADIAMYHAKRSHLAAAAYSSEHDHHSPARLALAADLRRALDGEELVPWYQPQVDVATGAVTAVEALARWEHPSLGLLHPGAFIEVAETTGLIRSLTLRVLTAGLRDRARWALDGVALELAVNVSVRSLLDPQFPTEVARALRAAGAPPECLKLEITESTIMADPATAKAVLEQLAAMGVGLAVDDFGTGYSSLAYLKELPVGELKIDRSFVINMHADRDDALIVRSTIELAHNLGLRVVAEGVEGAAALAELRRLGCDGAQGYHLSRPLPAPRVPGEVAALSSRGVAVEHEAAR
jgi:diguanylate cyclase (GGDEF)-like protein